MVPCLISDTTLALVSLRHMIIIILVSPIKLAGMGIQSIKTRQYVQPPVQILHDDPSARAYYTSFLSLPYRNLNFSLTIAWFEYYPKSIYRSFSIVSLLSTHDSLKLWLFKKSIVVILIPFVLLKEIGVLSERC